MMICPLFLYATLFLLLSPSATNSSQWSLLQAVSKEVTAAMDISHVRSLRTAFVPAHIQLACDGVYLALPLTRCSVGVWNLQNITCKPLELEGHSKILTSMALGNCPSPKLLVSAADDYVIVWNLQLARQQLDKGESIRGKVIGTTLGRVNHSCLSPNDSIVAVCSGCEVIVLEAKRECRVATLEGHTSTVTCAEFCPHYTATLVSISDDRSYKVWNLADLTLVYQSPILTASPFISLAMSSHQPHVAIGAADGVIRIFDLTDGNGFRCLHQLDISKVIAKQCEDKRMEKGDSKPAGAVTISSVPSWKQPDRSNAVTEVGEETSVEAGCSVLGLYYTYRPRGVHTGPGSSGRPAFLQDTGVVGDLLAMSPMLLVGTTAGLLQIDARSMDVCAYIDFQDPIMSCENLRADTKVLNAAGCVYFGQVANQSQVWSIIGSHFQNVVHALFWNPASPNSCNPTPHGSVSDTGTGDGEHPQVQQDLDALTLSSDGPAADDHSTTLTVLSNAALLEDSPLRSEFKPKATDLNKERKPKDFVNSPQKGKILDHQALTFKTKVKSSGYTEAPRRTMFTPKTNFSKSPSARKPQSGSKKSMALGKEYPMMGVAPTKLTMKINVAERPTAINSICVSDDGDSIACSLANRSAQVFTLPLSGKGSSYTGHNHVVSCVNWSHCGSRLVTSSDDKTAAIWMKGQSEPVLTFSAVQRSVTADVNDGTKPNKLCTTFSREVRYAQFYYMDRFVLLASGGAVYLYKYHVDTSKPEIQRYLNSSKYQLVQQWQVEAQQVAGVSAVNSFYSYIALVAGSNKTVEVYDLNVGQRVRQMTDVHSRPICAICQNEGSAYTSHPSTAYDLFATSAAGDCIKLWDLRTDRCVRRYEGHHNRVHPCGIALSPCGRFIATGGEDKCTYIFDIRSGTYSHKLMGHTDVVSDVAFHPLHPQLYSASLDGKLLLYTNR